MYIQSSHGQGVPVIGVGECVQAVQGDVRGGEVVGVGGGGANFNFRQHSPFSGINKSKSKLCNLSLDSLNYINREIMVFLKVTNLEPRLLNLEPLGTKQVTLNYGSYLFSDL